MRKNLTTLLMGLLFIGNTIGQSSSNFFNDIEVMPSVCNNNNGSISVESSAINIDYEWDDGTTELVRSDLEPGIYTLMGIDEKGCSEEVILKVPNIEGCTFFAYYDTEPIAEVEVNDGYGRPCGYYNLMIYMGNDLVSPDLFNITWTATGTAQTSPPTSINYSSNSASIPIYSNGTEINLIAYLLDVEGALLECCYHTENITVGNVCRFRPPLYVHKANFGDTNENNLKMHEFFVYGDGTCGGTTDLRGFIIDDNNGELIPPLGKINNGGLVNATNGYIQFSNNPSWANVPNGSFITIYDSGYIYDEKTKQKVYFYPQLVAQEDPMDSNNDFNYVVGIQSIGEITPNPYFDKYYSGWDVELQTIPYTGTQPYYANWTYISTTGTGDALQTRFPDGSYCHGVAHGSTPSSVRENRFELYITDQMNPSFRIQMNELSEDDKTKFSVVATNQPFQIGVPETQEMLALVNELRTCGDGTNGLGLASNPTNSNNINTGEIAEITSDGLSLNVSPNPFQEYLNIEYQSTTIGIGEIHIYNSQGKIVNRTEVECDMNFQSQRIDFGDFDVNGLYFIVFHYPNSKTKTAKAIMLNNK